jgi:Ubiquitin family
VRVKRQNQTFFIPCSADGTISAIKENIAIALNFSDKDDGVTAKHMRLLLPTTKSHPTVLDDNQTLTHYDIKNDAVLHVVFQISENTWETEAVESMEIASASAPN